MPCDFGASDSLEHIIQTGTNHIMTGEDRISLHSNVHGDDYPEKHREQI